MSVTTGNTRSLTLLRRVLGLDSIVTAGNGLIYLVVFGPVSRLLEVPVALLVIAGIALVAYGAMVGYIATRPEPAPSAVQAVILINSGWVLASVAAVALSWLEPSTIGVGWILIQAAAVAGLAAAQAVLLRRWRSAR
jgi:hypothetical protein